MTIYLALPDSMVTCASQSPEGARLTADELNTHRIDSYHPYIVVNVPEDTRRIFAGVTGTREGGIDTGQGSIIRAGRGPTGIGIVVTHQGDVRHAMVIPTGEAEAFAVALLTMVAENQAQDAVEAARRPCTYVGFGGSHPFAHDRAMLDQPDYECCMLPEADPIHQT